MWILLTEVTEKAAHKENCRAEFFFTFKDSKGKNEGLFILNVVHLPSFRFVEKSPFLTLSFPL